MAPLYLNLVNYYWATVYVAMLAFIGPNARDPKIRLQDTTDIKTSYDFIVIGGGTAGSVIANRLSEIGEWSVLLLEAGGDEAILGQVPANAAGLQLTPYDWQYKTIEQASGACHGSVNKQCFWPAGKVMGGSSAINYMLYVRGNRRDYDRWAAMGNTGWSYDDVLPYFVKSEDNKNPKYAATKYHGTGGYLTVEEAPYRTPLAEAFIQGGQELGYQERDCNGEFQTGIMIAQATTRKSHRCSAAKAFLLPLRNNRNNLQISKESLVLKINIDPKTKQTTGVTFDKKGQIYYVRATKEVIVSAGTKASPQLLMLSGIGPAAHLNEMGINVLSDLPVGQNLQDHTGLGGMIFQVDQPVSIVEKRIMRPFTVFNYTINGGTPFSVPGAVEAIAWVNTKYADPNDDWPDIQFHIAAGSDVSEAGNKVRRGHGISDAVWDEYFKPIAETDSFSIMPVWLRPKSVGWIKLRSNDPYDKPVINPNYFNHPQDLKVMIEGVRIAYALGNTQALKEFGAKFYDKPFPGCEGYQFWSDEYIGCWIKGYTVTMVHDVGTCKMGPSSDPVAVVDPQLRVRGIKGLRVADNSIMPLVPSGNTMAPVIMVGEKLADMVKNYWGQRRRLIFKAREMMKTSWERRKKFKLRFNKNKRKSPPSTII